MIYPNKMNYVNFSLILHSKREFLSIYSIEDKKRSAVRPTASSYSWTRTVSSSSCRIMSSKNLDAEWSGFRVERTISLFYHGENRQL